MIQIDPTDRHTPAAVSREAGHEPDAVNQRLLLYSFAALGVGMLISLLIVSGWKSFLEQTEPPTGPWAETREPKGLRPAIDENQPEALTRMRARNLAVLQSYGYRDRKRQTVRIPIERALEIAAQRGLESISPSAKSADNNNQKQ